MTLHELFTNPSYVYHHTASRKGYESRKGIGHVEPYQGRFGVGYIHVKPRYDTNNYVYVSYYILRED